MRAPSLSASLILASAVALAACGDDGASSTDDSTGNGSGGADSSSSTRSSGPGQGGDGEPSSSSTASSSPTTGTLSGGGGDGAGPSGPGGTGGETSAGGGDPGAGGQGGEGGSGPPPCSAGVILCDGTIEQICDGNGGFQSETECAPGGCIPGLGCTVCQAGTASCDGNTSSVCRGDGSGYDVFVCDPVQGSVCDAGTGHCTGTCSPEMLGDSYIGCDYFPTVTANQVSPTFNFAVAVSNISDLPADVTITRGGATVSTTTVAADSVAVITLPWVTELKDAVASVMLADGAYRLRTTQPVTVYQYSPLQYTTGFVSSYSNDASLLLPTNAWTGNYRVAARNSWTYQGVQAYPGFYAVTALADNTTVTLSPSATGGSIIVGGGVPANGAGTVLMNEGDVLQVMSTVAFVNPDPNDVTGTLIAADRPVQVIGGSKCTFIPSNIGYCDHLEESMPPIETLATEYIVTPPLIPTGGNTPKAQMVRVIATEANTMITYDPPQGGAPTTLANPGDYFEIPQTLADFVITGDKPILVSQYMQGQDAGGGSGDPAMALAVATEQYRDEYLFHAPTNYDTNYVNITAPDGATITLDGVPVGGFTPIGASGYGVARVGLSNAGDGNHYVTGTSEFGISVYGYGQYTSYWYPGGLDLEKVN
jgi:hypothetical protein